MELNNDGGESNKPYGNSFLLLHWISMWLPGCKSFKQSEIWRLCGDISTGGALILSHGIPHSLASLLPCEGYL